MIDWIWIYGGEPLDSDNIELFYMLREFREHKPIVLFTRYSLDKVPDYIKEHADYIKCGEYIPELTVDNNIQYGITLSTSNQKIYKKGVDY